MRRNRILLLLLVSIIPVLSFAFEDAHSVEWQTRYEELVFKASEFKVEEGSGLTVDESGLSLSDPETGATYTSPPIEAPFAFSAIFPQWLADVPDSSSMEIYLRTGKSKYEWSGWQEIHPWHDLTLPEDEVVSGEISFVPANDGTHSYVQFMITLGADDKRDKSLLHELRLAFVDATGGRTTAELVEIQKDLDKQEIANQEDSEQSLAGYPKPFVISRAVWCTDPRCNYSEGLKYHPVTHLVLHHSGSFSDRDSADVMFTFWQVHYGKGWGDVGYNFVVDADGYIFEGHLGGDDVVGTHAREANTGSMGLSMMGNYSSVEPSPAMQESIIKLFAWKADQRDIDVFDASDALPYADNGFPHIMTHHAVNATICPGYMGHSLIPTIRDEVAARIGLESPHIYVDELSDSFIKSSANWYVPKYQCGHNTHSWYTWSTMNPAQATNWGEWRLDVPRSGRYQIEAHIPYCLTNRGETTGAHYTIKHASGTSDVVISHQDNAGLWASLGEFNLQIGNENVIHLTDLTTTDNGQGVWFDSVRLLPLETVPTAMIVAPADNTPLNDRQVQFKWQIENPEEVAKTTLQVATDSKFKDKVTSKAWNSAVESFTQSFDRDYGTLYWRVVLKSKSDTVNSSPTGRFSIDTKPPVSSVKDLAWLDWNQQYWISWGGNDALNHIASYNIEFRAVDGSWKPWLPETSGTAAYFSPPVFDQIYEFRSQATDNLGNVEAAHPMADASTEQAKSFSHVIILPVVYNK